MIQPIFFIRYLYLAQVNHLTEMQLFNYTLSKDLRKIGLENLNKKFWNICGWIIARDGEAEMI